MWDGCIGTPPAWMRLCMRARFPRSATPLGWRFAQSSASRPRVRGSAVAHTGELQPEHVLGRAMLGANATSFGTGDDLTEVHAYPSPSAVPRPRKSAP